MVAEFSASPLRWHTLHLIWSCFSWGHVVYCTFDLCVHIEYNVVKKEDAYQYLENIYLVECGFRFILSHYCTALFYCKRWLVIECVSSFGTKSSPWMFMQHNVFFFWKSIVLRQWVDFLSLFFFLEVGRHLALCIFSQRKWYSF